MADILDQSEVDALLAAVSSGDTSTFESRGGEPSPREFSVYDFKRPERVSKDQMRSLQAIHEGFARNFGASLSAFLRTIVETRVATAEQLTYSEFIHSLPSPTSFNMLSAPQLAGQVCLELSPLIVFPIVDRLLGGTNSDIFIPQRPLTSIEQRLVNRIIDRALGSLTEAWSELVEVKFELAGSESNPHLVQIVAPNEVVVVIGFEIKVGSRAGTMSICIPFNVIEPVIGKLAVQSWLVYSTGGSTSDQSRHVTRNLRKAELPLTAMLGETTITVNELMDLAPGDIIQLEKLIDRDFILEVRGQKKFAGKLGKLRGKRALQITRNADSEEPL
ncbi:MAG: flagellar motor switch protein FliM [Planctomycetia bacterium]|jgi:flagellar motor switch protein FliM|nr:flagellar motor switch protein FliM [Planctomycetia bacterium]MCC7313628.1 flagellar motor switch protein FliM [Planctomycetota bacterium]